MITDAGVPGRPWRSPPYTCRVDFPDPSVDYREHPELYRVARGERGVFHVQPYKGELLPLWRFRTPAEAEESADAILARFREYREAGDLVGMDMARKYLQIGYTRSRRYAKYPGGRKYRPDGGEREPTDADPQKAASAESFRARWREAADDPAYRRAKAEHRRRYG